MLRLAPDDLDGVEADLIRREPVVLGMVEGHPWASRTQVAVAELAEVALLMPSVESAGEWRDFVAGFCRTAGFDPTPWRHVTHGSVAAADALRTGECVVPTMAWTEPPVDVAFVPLVDPRPIFSWSAMWRSGGRRVPGIRAFRHSSRIAAESGGWLAPV